MDQYKMSSMGVLEELQVVPVLEEAGIEHLLKCRKLVLLVDLDQTLLHTTDEKVPSNLKDVHHYQLKDEYKQLHWFHTKLRPHTSKFLESISKLFELHICTLGSRTYAEKMTGFLDPQKKYFQRIISREDLPNPTMKSSSLRSLFPCGDSMVAMIDDRGDVWGDATNLILVKPYTFFDGTTDINAHPGAERPAGGQVWSCGPMQRRARIVHVPVRNISTKSEKEEVDQGIVPNANTCQKQTSTKSEFKERCPKYQVMIEWEDSDKHLMDMKHILEQIHRAYYETHDLNRRQCAVATIPDLKSVVPLLRRNVLKGKNILFTGILMANQTTKTSQAYRIASSLGATIQSDFVPPGRDTSTTHVVAGRRDTEKVYRASRIPAVHIVSLDWLQACSDRWEGVHEHRYALKYVSPVDVSSRPNSVELVDKKRLSKKRSSREESNCNSSVSEVGFVPKDDNDLKKMKLDDSNTEFSADDIADIIGYIIQ